MNSTAAWASGVLDAVIPRVVEAAIERHVRYDASLPHRYGRHWRQRWTDGELRRLQCLSQAVAMRRPAIFAECVRQSGIGFVARCWPIDDLRTNLQILGLTLCEQLPDELSVLVEAYLTRGATALRDTPSLAPPPSQLDASPNRVLAERYLKHLFAGQADDARRMLIRAADRSLSVADVYETVLWPAQVECGRLWRIGRITVAEEHYATAVAQSVMSILRQRVTPARKRRQLSVIVATLDGELHEIGARMVADFFAMAGWNTMFLGASVPIDSLLDMVFSRNVDVLALSVGCYLNLRKLGECIDELQAVRQGNRVRIIVGGEPFNVFPDLTEELNAHGWAYSASEGVQLAEQLCDITQPASRVEASR